MEASPYDERDILVALLLKLERGERIDPVRWVESQRGDKRPVFNVSHDDLKEARGRGLNLGRYPDLVTVDVAPAWVKIIG